MSGEASPRAETVLGPQQAASDPSASAWVTANAGTGKTRVLVDRAIRLMLAGADPVHILCLTFTKAAAAEMANRLFDRLGEWTRLPEAKLMKQIEELTGARADGDQLAAARRLFAHTLDVPGGLKIQTIHSFCESLIGRFPIEAGIAPHFEVMDERTAAELLSEARDQVLAAAALDGELGRALGLLVVAVDEGAFAGLMQELAANRGRLRQALHGGVAAAIGAVRRRLGLAPGDTEQTLLAGAAADAAFDAKGLRRACAALERGSDKDRERAAILRAFLDAPAVREEMLRGDYRALFLTRAGEPRADGGLVTQAARESDPEAATILMRERARIHELALRLNAVKVAESTEALLRVADALLAAYDRLKTDRALLDYDDLILRARELLEKDGGASWVLYKLDGGIDHILIDEAQDTSPEQWDVIAALAEEFFAGLGAREEARLPRTVFAVGDEKQSIFSFQGADLRTFARMRAHFESRVKASGGDWRPVRLEMSFRSAPSVLKAVDLVFAQPSARDGVVAEGGHVEHRAVRAGAAGLVELWPTVKPGEHAEPDPAEPPLAQTEADNPPARLAQAIAKQIKEWLDRKEILPSRGRPIEAGDIMILVRRRNVFFEEMVRALKVAGVPVAGADRMVLAEQLAVMDLMALGQFVLCPEDDLTLAVVLKGPLFGLDDDDLFQLAHGRAGSLWRRLAALAPEDARFAAARGELSELLARADTLPPFEFFSELLSGREGRKRIVARLGQEANDPIDEFLGLALAYERSHPPSLQGFLHWVASAGTEVKRDLEQARREVRVMTVHGAKGLDADIVFLPDTCAVPDHRQDSRVIWIEDERAALPLWPARSEHAESVCAAARAEERARRLAEYRRLLYVAMTRAADRLYVCGYEGTRGRAEGCWYDLIRNGLATAPDMAAAPCPIGPEGLRLTNAQTAAPEERRGRLAALAKPPPLPLWARTVPRPEPAPSRPLAPSRAIEPQPPALSPLAEAETPGALAARRGRIIHRLLELLPQVPAARRAEACRRYLAQPVHGLTPESQAEIVRETLAVLESPGFESLFGPDSRAEVPLAGRVGDTVIAGQLDRLCITGDSVLILDYKTGSVPEAARAIPAAYLRQMAAYRALLANIYPGRAVSCSLLFTAAPKLLPIPPDLLDAHAP